MIVVNKIESDEVKRLIRIANERILNKTEKEKLKNIFSNNNIEIDVELFNELYFDGIFRPSLKQSSFLAMVEKFDPIDVHDHDLDTIIIKNDINDNKNEMKGYFK